MAHVSPARSHLYFDSLHRMTHFFCLTHSAVRILISNSYKAPGSLSAPEKKKEKRKNIENEKAGRKNKWDCYISWKLEQKFRPPPLSQQRSAEQRGGPRLGLFSALMGARVRVRRSQRAVDVLDRAAAL